MIVRCDKCHVEYDLNLSEQRKKTESDILIRYFLKCPNCGYEIDVMYENNSVRKMRAVGEMKKEKFIEEMSRAREEFQKGEQENGRE